MKKFVHILTAVILGLSLSACSGSFKDIKLTACELASLSPRGLSAFDAVLNLSIDNPAPQVSLSGMTAVIKMNQLPCLHLTAEDITISPRTELIYPVTFHGTLDENFNPFTLIALLKQPDLASMTVDVAFRGTLKSGLGKNFEYHDIPVKDFLGQL